MQNRFKERIWLDKDLEISGRHGISFEEKTENSDKSKFFFLMLLFGQFWLQSEQIFLDIPIYEMELITMPYAPTPKSNCRKSLDILGTLKKELNGS